MKLTLKKFNHEGYNKLISYINNKEINEIYYRPIISFNEVLISDFKENFPLYDIEIKVKVDSILDDNMKKKTADVVKGLVEIILKSNE